MSNKREEKKERRTFKEKLHDYMMDMSRISPSGLTDRHEEYYFHINRYYSFE